MNKLVPAVLPLLLMTLTTGGCTLRRGGFETKERIPVRANRLLIHPSNAHELGFSVQWATDLDLDELGGISHTAIFGDAIIVVAAESNHITSIAMRDGSINWQLNLGESAERLFPPVQSGRRLLINSETHLYNIDLDRGRLLAVSELESVVNTGPAVIGDYAIFGGANHRVFAHDATAGYSKWSYELTAPIIAPPVPIGTNVFAADKNGVYALYVGETGELLWNGRAFASVSVPAVTSPLGIFVASEDHSLYALNPNTGRDRWIFRYTAPLTVQPSMIARQLYLTLPDQGLASVNPRNGDQLWRIDDDVRPVAIAHDLLLGYKDRVIQLLDPQTGEPLTAVPTRILQKIIHDGEGRFILVSPTGRLLRLDPVS